MEKSNFVNFSVDRFDRQRAKGESTFLETAYGKISIDSIEFV